MNASFSQQKDPRTIYSYGGIPDSSRFDKFWIKRIPLNFKTANFDSTHFMSKAYFGGAKFYNRANFGWGVQFDSLADFNLTQFNNLAYFRGTEFHSQADFVGVKFRGQVDFREVHFDSLVDFTWILFLDTTLLGFPQFNEIQRYDFMKAKLNAKNAKIILCGPVDLKIQKDKFKFLTIWDKLDYYLKSDIISTLKDISFKEDKYKKERFELDYIFQKSTMYQVRSSVYAKNNWKQIHLWPKWIKNFIYNITMGLGYRPFRLAWWVLGFIIVFTFVYYLWIPGQINKYVARGDEQKTTSGTRRKRTRRRAHLHFTDTILNCFYFSSMMFFSIRLKRDILTFFSTKEKRVIAGEWLIGLIIYISFLTLSKSGSILHTLKSLFVGWG